MQQEGAAAAAGEGGLKMGKGVGRGGGLRKQPRGSRRQQHRRKTAAAAVPEQGHKWVS